MIRSMTGFGTAVADWQGGRLSVSLRTVNHRFLDVTTRLPPPLRPLETSLKKMIKEVLVRGRVEVSVEQTEDSEASSGRLNVRAAHQLANLVRELQSEGLVQDAHLRAVDFLRFPDVVGSRCEDENSTREAARKTALLTCLSSALESVASSRLVEGRGILADLTAIVGELQECALRIRERAEELLKTLPARYRARLTKILENAGSPVSTSQESEARLLQEAGILTERLDVSEEVERLTVHLGAVNEVLAEGGPCGKRLDFLAQELLREFNTVASKCRDSTLAGHVVNAKVLCERFREQVQNVE